MTKNIEKLENVPDRTFHIGSLAIRMRDVWAKVEQ